MTRTAVLRSALAAILTGVAVAVAVALVVPRTAPSQAATPGGGGGAADVLSGTPAPTPDAAHPKLARAYPGPRGVGFVRLRRVGGIASGARMADPLGGPDWVVRTFLARRVAPPIGRQGWHTIGTVRCAQLGRLVGGRFGWIDATNTFRPALIANGQTPEWCGSKRPDVGRRPELQAFTRITDPSVGAAAPLQGIVWGLVGPAGRAAVTSAGTAVSLDTGAEGTFLAALPGDRPPEVRLTTSYADAAPVVTDETFRGAGERNRSEYGRTFGHAPANRPLPALPRAAAAPSLDLRVPDPDGGLPWGIAVVAAEGGGWCRTALQRVVGDRVGSVDFRLGTFTDAGPDINNAGCPTPGSGPSAAHPAALGWSTGGGFAGELGDDPRLGRVARRGLPGLTIISGTVLDGARSLTIATPRDVRTFVPSPRAHAVAVVVDGSFPTGTTSVTVTRADGTRHTERFETGL